MSAAKSELSDSKQEQDIQAGGQNGEGCV